MNLAAPAALALCVAALPVIALYILKMRRPPRVVSSTFLWEQALADTQANAPWQRLKPHLLLLLQLLALAALVLALARPFTLQAAAAPGDVVVALDGGSLMTATDVVPSRFSAAKARIGSLIDSLTPGARMSIVLVGVVPHVLIAQTTDHDALHRALDEATPSADSPAFAPALTVAKALAHGGAQSTLFVYRAAGEAAPPLSHSGVDATHVTTIGGALRDLAVAAFAVSRADDGSETALARVVNVGTSPVRADARLDVATGDPGRLVWRNGVSLDPISLTRGASITLTRTRLPAATVAVRIHLVNATGGSPDDLTLDDTAWAVAPVVHARRVVLVTPGNSFLALALAAIPGVQVNQQTPQTYQAASARCAAAVVFDSYLPATLPSSTVGVLAIAPPVGPHPALGVTVAPTEPATGLTSVGDPDHLLQNAGVESVAVDKASGVSVPFWANDVVDAATPLTGTGVSTSRTVMIDGVDGVRHEVVLGLSLFDGDWVLKPGFPLLMRNVLDYLAPTAATAYQPGERVALAPPPCTTSVEIDAPDGRRSLVAPADPFVAAMPGLYLVRSRAPGSVSSATLFAVNPTPASIFSPSPAPGNGAASTTAGQAPAQRPLDLSPFVAALAVLILSAEWWVSTRR